MNSGPAIRETSPPRAYRARWIVSISRPPIKDGVVAIQSGRIIYAGEHRSWRESAIDLGDVAILPGLVNAHTHLEFSELATPFGQRGEDFARWIPQVVAHRRSRALLQQDMSISAGLHESAAHGSALLGEIATSDQVIDSQQTASMSGTIFHEFLGWDRVAFPAVLETAKAFVSTNTTDRWRHGLSPHAPYTVHRDLLARLCELAVQHAAPLAMHLAESPAELEFLATGQGPLRSMLESAGVWQPDFWLQPISTRSILEQLTRAPRSLVIHGNQLQSLEWDYLSEQREKLSVVYCPRTREFFFPDQTYPLEQMLNRGVAVAIGTDSRASNPDLSVWRELQFIAARHTVSATEILRLGTASGARALGFANTNGILEPGYSAACCVVRGASLNCRIEQLAECLLAAESSAVAL